MPTYAPSRAVLLAPFVKDLSHQPPSLCFLFLRMQLASGPDPMGNNTLGLMLLPHVTLWVPVLVQVHVHSGEKEKVGQVCVWKLGRALAGCRVVWTR